ncbi:MAG: hypothetical protein K0S47_1791 [Herbinix sp.]|jgi:histidinol-phosphatase (PHP family)|nr:hypothetical protein [Herbinix sp.]
MIIADYHVHSNFSSDSTAPMEDMIDKALALGLKKLCFTDHMDIDYPVVQNGYTFTFSLEEYIQKLLDLKELYLSKIELMIGVELGLQPHLKDQLNAFAKSYPFDFIIGSTHVVDHIDPYFPEYWTNRSERQGILDYFQSIIDNCSIFNDFHVYGHLDYIIRYIPGQGDIKHTYAYTDYSDILNEVLKTILSKGKGIEVNTSGFKYGLNHTHPKVEILKRYLELGGELITIGSDAHKPEHLCYDFQKAAELLTSLGYRYYATFTQGKPTMEKLV